MLSNPLLDLLSNPARLRTLVRAEKCRRSLAEFIRRGWHVLEPTTPLIWNWHIEAIAWHCQAALEDWKAKQAAPSSVQRIQNLVINVPPGTAKSRIVSVFTPAWMWLRCPEWRAIFLSANPRVALRDSIYCRDVIESDWYRELFEPTWSLAEDQNAKGLYRNSAGGFRQAIGFTARITGDRADALFVDDPHDAADVHSDTIRRSVIDRWDSAISNRVNDLRSSVRIGIMQRVHEDDWSGHVLETGQWEHLMLPMEYEHERARTTAIGWHDPRTEQGELLFPERFPPVVIEQEKRRLGTFGYAGQHQQRPAPAGGGLFKSSWFSLQDAAPAGRLSRVRYWDLASTMDAGDATCGLKMARTPEGMFVVEDVVHGRWSPHERDQVILRTAQLDGRDVGIRIEQEPGSAGVSLIASMVRLLVGFAVHPDRVTGDKVTRASPFAAQCEAGNVRVVNDPRWTKPYIDEMASFPFGKFDDRVDASSGAFNALANVQPPARITSGENPLRDYRG